MITLVYSGNMNRVKKAVEKANEILSSPSFYDAIWSQQPFDFAKLSPSEIADLMEQSNHFISIRAAPKPIANASTVSADEITVSSIRFSRHLPAAVNTLIHETVHAVDFLNGRLEFTHDGNGAEGQQQTAPWVIGAIAERMVVNERIELPGGDK